MADKDWYVYFVQSDETGYLYCGCTVDPIRRCHQHNHTKAGARCLRGQRPVTLLWYAKVEGGKIPAHRVEHWLKRHTKPWKKAFMGKTRAEIALVMPEKLPYTLEPIKL